MKIRCSVLAVLFASMPAIHILAQNTSDTRMMQQPAVSASQIAFIYANDLWVSNKDGSQPRRLTIDDGVERNPYFSPDGKTIAFSAEYDGNTDVYVVPSEGGVPKRLTWHPAPDVVRGFSADGKSVMFSSPRNVYTGRHQKLFTIALDGGNEIEVAIPHATWSSFSPDGGRLAYNPLYDAFLQWKNYRGGTVSKIWIYDFKSGKTEHIPQAQGGSNDVNPLWVGNTIYFRSDRNGEFNLYAYNTSDKEITQLTRFSDFPVLNAGVHNNELVFEQAGYLHKLTPGQQPQRLKIGIATDLLELRSRFVKGKDYIRWAKISPTGQRAVFDFRGDIVTVPVEKGDPRNITATADAHEKFPAWSPDGTRIAYFSDAAGEYALHIRNQDGLAAPKTYTLNGTGFYASITWSPKNDYISFVDNGRNLYVLHVASGAISKVNADEVYTPGTFRDLSGDWSADGKWLAYTKILETQFSQILLYNVDEKKSYPLTDGLSNADKPVFDRSGKYLFFLAATDAGPVVNWFDQSNQDMISNSNIYLVTLQKETISPFAKESDEEKIKDTASAKPDAKPTPPPAKPLRIDWDGIDTRIVSFPLAADNYGKLGMGKEDELIYTKMPRSFGVGTLYKYDIKNRKETEVMPAGDFEISADGKKMLTLTSDQFTISNTGEKPLPGKGTLNVGAIQVQTEPLKEWKNIFEEAWRVNRDYFYDPKMHGADWPAMKKKYEAFLPDVTNRADLNRLIQWMSSELAVGHHRIGNPGDVPNKNYVIGGGLLGADYGVENNRFRISKIYGGLNWNPNMRSPLTEPGVNAKVGDYVIAVNGKEVKATDNLYSFFENTAGKIVDLTLNSKPEMAGSRTVKVVPVNNDAQLRQMDWVEGNIKKVDKATNGQVAYVYVPNTTTAGHEFFKRYFYPQADKKAIIIDERFNGGGQIADYYITLLTRPYQASWNMRYGKDIKTPSATIEGPKVMIIDETAGSGGDMLPWMFRKFEVGTLVGKRTWGGLVGVLGFPEFLDGGNVTAPNLAIYTDEGFIVENVGVAPDIEVEQDPAKVMAGHDPQLEKAIQVALDELKKNPPPQRKRPEWPVRVRR